MNKYYFLPSQSVDKKQIFISQENCKTFDMKLSVTDIYLDVWKFTFFRAHDFLQVCIWK